MTAIPAAEPALTRSASSASQTWLAAVPAAAALSIALVFTLDGYYFGLNNQIEQLPMVMSLMQDGFLARDDLIQMAAREGPRAYYARLLALGGQLLPLPALFFLLTLAGNAATLLITFRASQKLMGSLVAAYAALVLLVTLHFHVRLGDAGFLLTQYLTPASLAIPGMVGAIYAALRGRSRLAIVVAGLTSVIHPLYGLAGGALALLVGALQLWRVPADSARRRWLAEWAPNALAFAICFALLWYRPNAAERLPDAEFFRILAKIRAPHHFLPSVFRPVDWLIFASFTAASLSFMRSSRARLPELAALCAVGLVVMLGFAVGYVFVEVIPTRAVLSLHTYRFTCITSWIGIVLAAGAASAVLDPNQTRKERRSRAIAAGLGFALIAFGALFPPREGSAGTLATATLLALSAGALHATQRPIAALAAVAVALAGFGTLRFAVYGERDRWLGNRLPAFSFDDVKTDYDDVARYAREHTSPADAFIITDAATSANAGTFRYTAERALFVDYKVFPFSDAEMADWNARMSALGALSPTKKDDAKLLRLASRYQLSFAVMPKLAPTDLPVAFTGKRYQLVSLRKDGGDEISAGQELFFGKDGEGESYLVKGWSKPEPWGVWSDERRAELALPLPSPADNLELWLLVGAFLAPGHPEQSADCWINGTFVDTLRFDESHNVQWRRLPVPGQALVMAQQSGVLNVGFDITRPGNPSAARRQQGHARPWCFVARPPTVSSSVTDTRGCRLTANARA